MKKFLAILVLGLLWCNNAFTETSNFEWIKNQTEFETSADLCFKDDKDRFKKLLKSNITDRKYIFGDGTLYNHFEHAMCGPPKAIVYSEPKRFVFIRSCQAQYCIYKGLAFIDTKDKYVIGVVRHFYTEPFDVKIRKKSEDFLIFSKTHKKFENLPEFFFKSVDWWIKGAADYDPINPQVVRFIGADDKIIDVTSKY